MKFLDATGLALFWNKIRTVLAGKQDKLTGSAGQLIGIGDDGTAKATGYPCNDNLLDNPYFVGGGSQQGSGQFPINQRGETEYSASGYTIERWAISSNSILSIEKDFIQIHFDASIRDFYQRVESARVPAGKYTFSILYSSDRPIRLYSYTSDYVIGYADFQPTDTPQVASCVFTVPDITNFLTAHVQSREADCNIKLYAAKFEPGPVQTLAHKENGEWVLNAPPPNYALELAKCQRYQVVYKATGDLFLSAGIKGGAADCFPFKFPVPMRAVPTISYNDISKLQVYPGNIALSSIVVYFSDMTGDGCKCTALAIQPDGTALTANTPYMLLLEADGQLIFDANL